MANYPDQVVLIVEDIADGLVLGDFGQSLLALSRGDIQNGVFSALLIDFKELKSDSNLDVDDLHLCEDIALLMKGTLSRDPLYV